MAWALFPERPDVGGRRSRYGAPMAAARRGAIGRTLSQVLRRLARFWPGGRRGREARTDRLPRELLDIRERRGAVAQPRFRGRQPPCGNNQPHYLPRPPRPSALGGETTPTSREN